MSQTTAEYFNATIRNSQTLRLLSIGFLVILLIIPIAMINELVRERQERRDTAVTEVSSKWGNMQIITGPALVVPYTYQWTETNPEGQTIARTAPRSAVFLPERLRINGTITTETRQRGIFSIPVYKLAIEIAGEFARPDFSTLGLEPAAVAWERAYLAIGIADARAIQEETTVTWNDRRVPFLPGTGEFTNTANGIQAMVGVATDAQRFEFSLPLALNGSVGVYFTPFGKSTEATLESNYPHPSYQGNWLPTDHSTTDTGFRATWSIPFLGRNYPQSWSTENSFAEVVQSSRFGVELTTLVDHYRMAERSVKYAMLFILLTFATIWLIEVLARVKVHPIQYLLLGGALCLFYLLELSLAEHLGFPAAYAIASVAVIGMVTAYARAILHRPARALIVGGGVTLLYVYLYILLINEDYSLLIGSIGLFVILGAIMYSTRRVDWYEVGKDQEIGKQT
jgi:inner membrane protein